MNKEREALTRIAEIVARCMETKKKPTQAELINILMWCRTGLGEMP